jgi:hypothetical protein
MMAEISDTIYLKMLLAIIFANRRERNDTGAFFFQ